VMDVSGAGSITVQGGGRMVALQNGKVQIS
jgi:hypothetical protein